LLMSLMLKVATFTWSAAADHADRKTRTAYTRGMK
jgi:hypothetical protein